MFFNLKRNNIFKKSRILYNATSGLQSTKKHVSKDSMDIGDFIKLDDSKRISNIKKIGDSQLIDWMKQFFWDGWCPSGDLLVQMEYSAGHLPLVRYLNTIDYFTDIRLDTFASMLVYKEYNCHTLTLSLDYFLNVVQGKESNIIAIPLNGIVGSLAPHTFNYSDERIIDALMRINEYNLLTVQSFLLYLFLH